jgi:hypothetical protein
MGLLGKVLLAPLAPLAGVVWLAERLEEQAAAAYYDPQAIAAQLDELESMRGRGLIGDREADEAAQLLLTRIEEAQGGQSG